VWGENNIFTFALQMTLILVSGYTLAQTPAVQRLLGWLAAKARSQVQGAVLVFFCAGVASLLNWGLGLIVAGVMAREVARRLGTGFHYGYLVAAGYMGYIVWTNGFSSSIALANTDPHSELNVIYQETHKLVPFSDSIFQPYSWIGVAATFVVFPFLLKLTAPRHELVPEFPETDQQGAAGPRPAGEGRTGSDEPRADHPTGPRSGGDVEPQRAGGVATLESDETAPARRTFAERMERAWILNLVLVAAGVGFFVMSGYALNIASMVMLFTVLGLLLHGTPSRFIGAFYESAKTSGSLLLQYPLYGGVIALLTVAPNGHDTLASAIAGALVNAANQTTLPFLNYVGSLIISLFVPSGGGHWGVQGPVTIAAAQQLGLTSVPYLGKLSMSVAVGEQVTNMIQPFWALPVLAIAGVKLRDMMGFTVIAFLVGGVIFGAATFIPTF
jgi:short-chain fatty acids transporter